MKINTTVTTYKDSVKFKDLHINQILDVGFFVYDNEENFYVILKIEADEFTLCKLEDNSIVKKTVHLVYRAYSLLELGIMLLDFVLPVFSDQGWAFLRKDGNLVITTHFYKSELEARVEFIFYLISSKVLEIVEINNLLLNNF